MRTLRGTSHRVEVILRHGETVSPLELFFDLVFVLAMTQCTALMAQDPTWIGIGGGLVVLGLLWWAWVGYSWLTSMVDPDEGWVRLVLFGAMAALLVTSLCVPGVFGDLGLIFAVAYTAVRLAHITLFVLASRDDPGLRRPVTGLAISTTIGATLLVAGALVDGNGRLALWAAALLFDMTGPLVIDASTWRLVPGHFAERYGLIVIVALGESMLAIGIGSRTGVDGGVIVAAVLGIAIAATLWWAYFDATGRAAAHLLTRVDSVPVRNRLARDGFSYLHLPMVAAVVLFALGMKKTLAHVGDPLTWETGTALVGGAALYLMGNVAFRRRVLGVFNVRRFATALLLLAFLPLAGRVDALLTVAFVATVLAAMIAFETARGHLATPSLVAHNAADLPNEGVLEQAGHPRTGPDE
ncbi:MAG: low temperature requirement protein A [Actinomycetota bacterium]|nr:low temperature requirement protein A [Actinomycetota bacterium]